MIRTEDVRDSYVYNSESNQWPGATVRREREFDEWLAQVVEKAYERGVRDGLDRAVRAATHAERTTN